MRSTRGTRSAPGAMRIPLGATCVLIVACLGIAACGGGDPKPAGKVVARVNGNAVTKATLDHWTDVEAVLAYENEPKRPVPVGVVPDPPTYAKCIGYLMKTTVPEPGESSPTRSQLKRRCHERRTVLQRHVLDILLTYYWLSGDAREQGVKVTGAEITKIRDRVFPGESAYRRYLSITGERPADERLIIEKDLLDTKLLQLAEAKFRPKPTSVQEHDRMMAELGTAFTSKWKARTSCSAGYVVAECRQYTGPPSPVLP